MVRMVVDGKTRLVIRKEFDFLNRLNGLGETVETVGVALIIV